MNAHFLTGFWRQRILQSLAQAVHKQKCAKVNIHHSNVNSVIDQKYSHKASSQTSHSFKAAHFKSNPHSKKEVAEQSSDTKKTDPTRREGITSKHPYRRFPWLEEIHRILMKSVIIPSEKRDCAEFMDKSAQSYSTSDLMAMAQDIKSINMETMKIIVALWHRFDSMTVEEILTAADIFFKSGVSVPWYNSAMITYVEETFHSLSFTPLQLTRLVFHISNHGSAPPSLLNNIEKRIIENLSYFDINLVAMICQLHFTGQNRIKSPILVDKIAVKLLGNLSLLNEQYFPMMMKMFRFSNYIKISFYKELGDRLVTSGYIKQFYSQSQIMHIAFTYASVRITHPQLFQCILMQCRGARRQHRFKDIAKIMWACGTLVTCQKENISCIHDILLQLKQNNIMEQAKEYPDNLVDLLMGLVLLKIYPYDLINILFDPAILTVLTGLPPDREKFYQLHFLDHSLSIECPDYSGFHLSEADRKTVAQKVSTKSLEMDIQLRKSVKPACLALEKVLGSDCVQCTFILPHCQTSDILLAYDMDKKLFVKPVTKPLRSIKPTEKAVVNKTRNLVLLLMSRMQTTYDGQPLGLLQCKIRQLQALGYTVIMVNAEEALLYACLDMETTQKLLLGHICAALEVDVRKFLPS